MSLFAIYPRGGGPVRRVVSCRKEHVAGQCAPDETWLQCDGWIETHRYAVSRRKLVELPEAPVNDLEEARAMRDRLLSASDWTQVPDNRLSPEHRAAWAAVREAWRQRVDDIKAGLEPGPWAQAPE